MIWYFIVIGFLVLSLVTLVISDNNGYDGLWELSAFNICLSGLTLATFIVISLTANTNINAKLAELDAERQAIYYQLSRKTYMNDNNVGANEIFEKASKFNQRLRGNRLRKMSSWTNWLYSDVWLPENNLQLIDFEAADRQYQDCYSDGTCPYAERRKQNDKN